MMRAPHLEQDEASGDGWLKAHRTLALVALDEEACVRGHEAASYGLDGFLRGFLGGFNGACEADADLSGL